MNSKDFMDRLRDDRERAFEGFMSEPLTRFAISLIPPGDHQDTLKALLRAAFDACSHSGQGSIAAGMVSEMIDRNREGR